MPSAEILCVSWHSTLPQNTGANIRIRSLLQEYKKFHPVLLAPAPTDSGFEHVQFSSFKLPSLLNRLLPFNADIFACLGSKPFNSALQKLQQKKFIAVQCEHLWTYPLAKKLARHFQIPLLLVEHNIEATYVARVYGKPAITALVRRLEQKAIDGSDRIIVCSQIDAGLLQQEFKCKAEKIWIVPNGVYSAENNRVFGPDSLPSQLRERNFVVFLGKTSYQPNREAIEVIRNELVGRLREKGIIVAVVGGPAAADYTHIDDGFVFTGFVTEIEPYVLQAKACIAPLVSGSGTRLKILEYAGLGRPIVATSVAAEGIDLQNDTEILLRDDWAGFSEAIIEIQADDPRWKNLGQRAKKVVQQKYRWQAIAEEFELHLSQLKT